jgi:CARDB
LFGGKKAMKKAILVAVLALIAGALASGQSTESRSAVPKAADPEKPDLVPVLAHPMNGKVVVKNIGRGFAAPSKLTLDCEEVSTPVNACPDLPVSAAATYFDPAFPKNATIEVPALSPGEIFVHTLSFWDTFHWATGRYRFTALVDAAHVLSESNTKNNVAVSTLVVP